MQARREALIDEKRNSRRGAKAFSRGRVDQIEYEPRSGDRLEESIGGSTTTWEVLPPATGRRAFAGGIAGNSVLDRHSASGSLTFLRAVLLADELVDALRGSVEWSGVHSYVRGRTSTADDEELRRTATKSTGVLVPDGYDTVDLDASDSIERQAVVDGSRFGRSSGRRGRDEEVRFKNNRSTN